MRSMRLSPEAYRIITALAVAAVTFIIVTGAAVRLTGSGLGCSDWPTCENDKVIAPFEYHAMVEFVNRTITGFVSVAVILAVLGSLVRVPMRRDLTRWSLGLVAGVVAQVVLGGIVVKTELLPVAVIPHFLLSMVLVWNALVLHERSGCADAPAQPVVSPALRRLGAALVGIAIVVLFAGTLVTGAGPHSGSGDAGEVERLGFDVSTVVRFHSVAVWVLVGLTCGTLWMARRERAPDAVMRRGFLLLGVIFAQGAIGYAQYFTGVPVLLVGIHVLGAVLVWIAVLAFDLGLRERPPEVLDPIATSTTSSELLVLDGSPDR